jgi:hypothetical protein
MPNFRERKRKPLKSHPAGHAPRFGTRASVVQPSGPIAAIEPAGATETLDYSGKRQALSDLGVPVAVYPSWHESPYRWVMSAFEMKDGGRRLWVDGEALNRVLAAASPDALPPRSPARTRAAGTSGLLYHACAAPSARAGRPGGRAWSAPASGRDRGRGAPARRRRLTDRRSG